MHCYYKRIRLQTLQSTDGKIFLWMDLVDTKEHYFSCNVAIQENRFKLCYRWYLTPVRILKMFGTGEGRCWQCSSVYADYCHMWRSCPEINRFWAALVQITNEIAQATLPMNMRTILLLDFDYAKITSKRNLLAHMTTAGSFCGCPALEGTDDSYYHRLVS